MDIKKLFIEEIKGDDNLIKEAFTNLLAFEGLKIILRKNNMTLLQYLMDIDMNSSNRRQLYGMFLAMPWALHNLDSDDVSILQQMHELISI